MPSGRVLNKRALVSVTSFLAPETGNQLFTLPEATRNILQTSLSSSFRFYSFLVSPLILILIREPPLQQSNAWPLTKPLPALVISITITYTLQFQAHTVDYRASSPQRLDLFSDPLTFLHKLTSSCTLFSPSGSIAHLHPTESQVSPRYLPSIDLAFLNLSLLKGTTQADLEARHTLTSPTIPSQPSLHLKLAYQGQSHKGPHLPNTLT